MNHQADFVRENLKIGLEMLLATPEQEINLQHYRKETNNPECGTLHCAVGLFTMHPKFAKFIALQLLPDSDVWGLTVVGAKSPNVDYDGVLDATLDDLFGPKAWDDLFSAKWWGDRDHDHPSFRDVSRDFLVSDRDLAIWRIKNRLEEFRNSTDAEIENYGREL